MTSHESLLDIEQQQVPLSIMTPQHLETGYYQIIHRPPFKPQYVHYNRPEAEDDYPPIAEGNETQNQFPQSRQFLSWRERKETKRKVNVQQSTQQTKNQLMLNKFKAFVKNENLHLNFIAILKKYSNNLGIQSINTFQQQIIQRILNKNLSQHCFENDFPVTIPVIDSSSLLAITFDILEVLLMLTSVFWYPLIVSFDLRLFFPSAEYILEYSLLFINLLDIILCLNKSTLHQGKVIKERVQIVAIYLRNTFIQDIFSVICLITLLVAKSKMLLTFVSIFFVMVRFPKIFKKADQLIEFCNFDTLGRDVIALINMIFTLVSIVHIIACGWHGITAVKSEEQTWIEVYGLQDKSLMVKYTVSFYWAAMTMTTVGYGDITPKNITEYIYADFIMLVSCVVFGYTMNRIGMLLTSINLRKADFKMNVAKMNIFMKKHKVDFELQCRIRSYLEYLWEAENNDKDVRTLINLLPEKLQQDLNYQVRGKFIYSTKFFAKYSDKLKKSLCLTCEDSRLAPNEVATDPKKIDGNQLHIIKEGQLQLQLKPTNFSPIQFRIQAGTVGELSFLTGQPHNMTVVSSEFTSTLSINRDCFLSLLNQNPLDKELFFYYKECIIHNNQFQKIGLQCMMCHSSNHMLNNCHLLNFRLDFERVLKNNLYPFAQKRTDTCLNGIRKRRRSKYNNSLRIQHDVQRIAEEVQQYMKDDNGTLSQQSIQENFQTSVTYQRIGQNKASNFSVMEEQDNREEPFKINSNSADPQKVPSSDDRRVSIIDDVYSPQKSSSSIEKQRKQSYMNTQFFKYQVNQGRVDLQRQTIKSIKQIIGSGSNENQIISRTQNYIPQSMIDQTYIQQIKFSCINDFDKMFIYTNYFPLSNYDKVIKKLSQNQQALSGGSQFLSKYSFNHLAMKKAERIRRSIMQQTKKSSISRKLQN